ncbi:MAG: S9 family peptidase [Luteimonas sp.]|nr:S9 family peptidase [Luteimonas sp.]
MTRTLWQVACFAVAWLCLCAAQAREPVDLDTFLRDDTFETLKISPDGKHYAATVQAEDRMQLLVLERDGGKIVTTAAGRKHSAIADFWWVGDDRIVLSTGETEGSRDEAWLTGELYGFKIGDTRSKMLFGDTAAHGRAMRIGESRYRQMASLIDTLPDDPEHVLIRTWSAQETPVTRVFRMDVQTGGLKTVAEAPLRRSSFTIDGKGVVRFAHGADDHNVRKLYYRASNADDWSLVNDEAVSGRLMTPLGFSADGGIAYLEVTQPAGPNTIEAWDPQTRERQLVLRDPVVDPLNILYDNDGRTPIGARYMSGGMQLRFFDENAPIARVYRALEKAARGSAVSISSFTSDNRHAMVRVWSDRDPGAYLLADFANPGLSPVFTRMAWLKRAQIAPTRAVDLAARDGVALHGYLTTPTGAGSARLPTVVMPHGGPFGVFDRWDFDDETQLLAAAGYAVLRVNFRGSGNYGQKFEHSGAREWGGTMQDDVTDATRWLIEQKIADPEKICIYGASYGAYAALMGAAREPALYACAAGYVGVYDLPQMQRDDKRYADWLGNWNSDWIGDRKSLAARSPVNLADRIKVPVFLAAGGQDTIAPIAHTRGMEKALRKHGVAVETLYYDSESHGFVTRPHREAYYRQLLAFLARHLGGVTAR